MALSNQLRNIANQARALTEQQSGIGMAQLATQAQQAIMQPTPGQPTKAGAQQLAAGITQGQQQVLGQAQQAEQQTMDQLAQQGLAQVQQQRQQQLGEQSLINEGQIAELQRTGQLRQNSASLKQSKQLLQDELAQSRRLVSAGLEFDNSLSFLTRKQRTDLASLNQYTKQQLFDNRLTFGKDELGRKFTNARQLADYAVSTAVSDQQLATRLQDMQQSASKELMALQQAQTMIQKKLELEYTRAEKAKDYKLLKELAGMKAAMDRKIARKKASASAIGNIIQAGFTISGAVI